MDTGIERSDVGMEGTTHASDGQGIHLLSALETIGLVAAGAGFGVWLYHQNTVIRQRIRAAAGSRSVLTAAGVVGAASLASLYFGTVMVKPRREGGPLSEKEELFLTSSGSLVRRHTLEQRPDTGAVRDYRSYMGHIPGHVLIYAAPIILAPTAHIIISMAQHSHALRKPLIWGAVMASVGAVAQRLYLMKDCWEDKGGKGYESCE